MEPYAGGTVAVEGTGMSAVVAGGPSAKDEEPEQISHTESHNNHARDGIE
jgi:hypothetical protein